MSEEDTLKRRKVAPTLRELRRARYMTIEEVAVAADITVIHLYHLEGGQVGEPQIKTIRNLAKALRITPPMLERVLKRTFEVKKAESIALSNRVNNLTKGGKIKLLKEENKEADNGE